MFSGIITDVGIISQASDRDGGLRLTIATHNLDMSDIQLGDSIAVNGVCLTVIEFTEKSFTVDVSKETLNCTTGLTNIGAEVNLEKALRLADRLGGHLVSGHVDGIGKVISFEDIGESWTLIIEAPNALAKYIAHKGSITVNGVSLTVNSVNQQQFSLNLIPHTLAVTTLKHLAADKPVNLEVDLIARYCERILNYENKA